VWIAGTWLDDVFANVTLYCVKQDGAVVILMVCNNITIPLFFICLCCLSAESVTVGRTATRVLCYVPDAPLLKNALPEQRLMAGLKGGMREYHAVPHQDEQ
jgi:hypothetical protein